MTSIPTTYPIQPRANRSPPRGTVPIHAFVFDTYGTVCDFYRPLKAAFDTLKLDRGVDWDSGVLAIEWRNAYARSTFLHAALATEFRPLKSIHHENLIALLQNRLPDPLREAEVEQMVKAWNRLEPWPDTIAGLAALKQRAIIAPLSNGNFDDMVHLARHARLPWDIILGSSIARAYKPAPEIYLESVAALCLEPEQVCMVAAHQIDLEYAAGHGMQTAFVIRRHEFGGIVKPLDPDPSQDWLGAAEVHIEGPWTYVVEDFRELAAQVYAGNDGPRA